MRTPGLGQGVTAGTEQVEKRRQRALTLGRELETTAEALGLAFRVADIATFPVATCDLGEEVEAVRVRFSDRFDFVPVRNGTAVVGVLALSEGPRPGKVVRERMEPLTDEILIEERASLISALSSLVGGRGFRLVLRSSKVEGIVTASDLLKLPVRTMAFSYITHLERVMAARISADFASSEEWLDGLSKKRKRGLRKKERLLKDARREPDLIELTDLCDKREVIKRHLLAKGERGKFERELKAVESLRNDLAHAAEFIRKGEDLDRLPRCMAAASYWSERLSKSTAYSGESQVLEREGS